MNKALIFAGNYEQARFYAKQLGLKDWKYLTAHDSRGLMKPVVYLVGTYYERPDFFEMRAALLPSQPKFLNESGDEITL